MITRTLFILISVATVAATVMLASGSAHAEKRVALVIGNSNYSDTLERLPNAVNDAKLIADTLKDLGFTIVGGSAQLNLDKTAMEGVLKNFGAELRSAEAALFYFTGYGVEIRGREYLGPISAHPTTESDALQQLLDISAVLSVIEGGGTKVNIVILDTARNNPFGGQGSRLTEALPEPAQVPEGTIMAYATQPGNVALHGTGSHSPFTATLVETMRKPGLDIFETFNDVSISVMRATGGKQQPWVSMSPMSGNFYFAGARAK